LIVDDHEVVRKGVRSLLQSRKDLEVCGEAADGEEAVTKAFELKPDLVVTDLTMPIMSGLAATKQIKALLPSLPILVLSMHTGAEMVRAAKTVGANGFVTKGELSSTLLKAVDALLAGENYFDDGC
jgi:two-component system response regulator NreC